MGVTSVLLTLEMFSTPSRLLPPSHTFLVQNRSPASEWVEHCCGLGSRSIHNSWRMFGGACTDRMGLSRVFPLSVNSDATGAAAVRQCRHEMAVLALDVFRFILAVTDASKHHLPSMYYLIFYLKCGK